MFAQKLSFVLVTFLSLHVLSVLSVPTNYTTTIQARANVGEGTYFTPGLGACGVYNTDADLVVAVSRDMFDTYPGHTTNPNLNPICGKKLSATYQGKTVTVTVADRWTGCHGLYDLDFSMTAIKKIVVDPVTVGRIFGVSWVWV